MRTAPPIHRYSSVWWSTFSSPHGRRVSFHGAWWAGSPRKVMCCTQEDHTSLSELRYPKYLKTLFNSAGVLVIKAGFHCPQSVLQPITELKRKASFPSDQLLYRAHVWRSCLIIPISLSFIRRLCPADSGWRPSIHQKPLYPFRVHQPCAALLVASETLAQLAFLKCWVWAALVRPTMH